MWDVMRGASSHRCGSPGDNTGTGRMRRSCHPHAPGHFCPSPAQQNRLAACSSMLAVYLGSGGLCLYQDRLIVTASPTYSEAPTARHTAASNRRHHHSPEAYPIQGSGRDTHHALLIDTISTPSLTINVEAIQQPVCTHVHRAIRTHHRLHDARLWSSALRQHCCCLVRRGPQELTWHWERGRRWERRRGAQSLTCDPPSLHLWRLLNNKRTCVPHRNANAHRRTIHSPADLGREHRLQMPMRLGMRFAHMLDACPCRP